MDVVDLQVAEWPVRSAVLHPMHGTAQFMPDDRVQGIFQVMVLTENGGEGLSHPVGGVENCLRQVYLGSSK